jgi:hypothetical protein
MSVDIQIHGIDQLIAKLGRVAAQDVLTQPMRESVTRLQSEMMVSPPAIAGSRYVRTGTLGRRWTAKVTRVSGGVTGRVGNNTVYAPFVQSQMFQSRVHVGRWRTDAQTLERLRPWVVERFQRRIRQALEGR